MDRWTIYHNPRCSKSRQALALLREAGVEPRVVEYLATPPRRAEFEELLGLLGLEQEPHALLRTGEAAYGEAGLSRASSREQVLDALERHPILLERPVVIHGERAVIGRPPERVRELLDARPSS